MQNGLEKISKFMMTALLLLIVVLAVHSLTLSNAAEGVKFYLVPNTEAVAAVGLKNVITAAMNQSFYTKSWRSSNGNFWKLYGKGSHISRRGCTNLCT